MKILTEREIFFEALEMPTPESRGAYLQGACGRDVTLRRKVALSGMAGQIDPE